MNKEIERNHGPQPIQGILEAEGLSPNDLVNSSGGAITHKMVARACKGRRLTPKSRLKVLDALNRAADKSYPMAEIFNYLKPKPGRLGTPDT
jgi:hypothetical protein